MKKIILSLCMWTLIALPLASYALTFQNPLGVSTIGQLLDRIISFLIVISVPILTAVVLYAGFVLLTSQGKPEEFNRAMMVLLYAAIGFGVILIAKGISLVIMDILS